MNTAKNQRLTLLLILLATNIVATILHYTDNFIAFEKYPAPAWLHPEGVYIAWLILTPLAIAGYFLYTKGAFWFSYLCLWAYSVTSVGGLLHYQFAPIWEFSWKMNALIWFEALAGFALISFTLWSVFWLQEWREQKTPFAQVSK